MTFFKSILQQFLCKTVILLSVLLPVGAVSAKNFVVTLDAGHGGKDYGALGDKSNEKTITLSVVKELGKLIEKNLHDVDVVYTRKSDVFVPLDERAAIANKAGSNLFISIHINSVAKRNRNRRNIEGCQVYTLGLHKTDENLAVAKRENSVMELESDHTQKYAGFDPNSLESDIIFELSQNRWLDQSIELAAAIHNELVNVSGRSPKGVRQAGFWVLWATAMPSVLVELDFICNPRSEKYLISDDGQNEMVTALYNAFCAYLNTYGSQITGRKLPVAKALKTDRNKNRDNDVRLDAPAPAPEVIFTDDEPVKKDSQKKKINGIKRIEDDSDKPRYYIQILASSVALSKNSPEFKDTDDIEFYYDGGMYKYAVGKEKTVKDAKKKLKKMRKKFPKCFIIKMVNGRRVGLINP